MLQEFVEAIEKKITAQINELHTAIPAEIVDFNPADCTATVKPIAKKVLSNGLVLDYPKISGVPVLFPQGAAQDSVIVFPVKAGDGCLLIICEQSLDYWRSRGLQSSEMKYSLSNAIAIAGLFRVPTGDVKQAIDTNSIVIRNGDSSISISKEKIAIRGNVEIEGTLTYH